MVSDAYLLNTQHYKLWIKGKWSNPRKGVAPSFTLWCCSYWKRSLWVALDYGRPTDIIIIIIMCCSNGFPELSFSPSINIIHHICEVFQATFCVRSELSYISSSWLSYTCTSMWECHLWVRPCFSSSVLHVLCI